MTLKQAYQAAKREWAQYNASYRTTANGGEVVVRDNDSNVVTTYPVAPVKKPTQLKLF